MVGHERIAEEIHIEEAQHREKVPPKNSSAASGPRHRRRSRHATANSNNAAAGNRYCHHDARLTCQRG